MEKLPQMQSEAAGKRNKFYACALIAACLLFVWIFMVKPPFGSPDEATHLFRANSLAHGYIMLEPSEENGVTGGEVAQNLGKAAIIFNQYVYTHAYKGSEKFVQQMQAMQWNEQTSFIGLPTTAFYLPAVYLPQAASFFIGEHLNLSLYQTYALVNVITYATCILLLILACRIYPIPAFSLVVMLLPMSLYQLFSPTIDGISLALTILAMSLFMRLLKQEKTEGNKPGLLIALSLCIIVAAGSRANLIFMVFIPLWLFVVSRRSIYLATFAGVAILTLGWIAFAVISSHDPSRHAELSNAQIIIWYLKHPLMLATIFFNTLTDADKLSFYYQSLIGNFAWLDAPLGHTLRDSYGFILVASLVAVIVFGRKRLPTSSALFIAALAIISIALIFAALLVQWSSFPTAIIEGVQGRYFIIPLAMLGYALPSFNYDKGLAKLFWIILAVLSTFAVHKTLVDRYQNFIDIPQENEISKESSIYNLDGSNTLKIKLDAPDGTLKSISVLMANYRNTAKGIVKLQMCSADQCIETEKDISGLDDNSFYRFKPSRALTVTGQDLTLEFSFDKNQDASPAALWLFRTNDNNKPALPKMQLKYSDIH